MDRLEVRDLSSGVHRLPPVLPASATLEAVVTALGECPTAREVYVVDDQGRLRGVVDAGTLAGAVFRAVGRGASATEILEHHGVRELGDLTRRRSLLIRDDDLVEHALAAMLAHEVERVPIVDADGRAIGCLDLLDLLAAWQRGELGDRGAAD